MMKNKNSFCAYCSCYGRFQKEKSPAETGLYLEVLVTHLRWTHNIPILSHLPKTLQSISSIKKSFYEVAHV